jgi:hypothetical protein
MYSIFLLFNNQSGNGLLDQITHCQKTLLQNCFGQNIKIQNYIFRITFDFISFLDTSIKIVLSIEKTADKPVMFP